MKLIKMLGIATIGALAAIAILGAGTAFADTACNGEVFEVECAKKNIIPNGTSIVGDLKSELVIKTSSVFQCKKSTMKGKITQNTGKNVISEIISLAFSECSGCKKVTVEGLPWEVQMKYLSYNLETKQQQDLWTVHNPKVKLSECMLGLTCTASAKEIALEMHVTPTETIVVANEAAMEMSGLGCGGETGKLSATYKLSEPTPLWISEV